MPRRRVQQQRLCQPQYLAFAALLLIGVFLYFHSFFHGILESRYEVVACCVAWKVVREEY